MADQKKKVRADQQKRLQEEREHTLAQLKALRSYVGSGTGRGSEASADSVDAAADISDREKTLAIIQTLEQKLAAIERALRATQRGSYGICEVCGQTIDPGRLEVMPHTTTCVKCQARLERQQPRRPSTFAPLDEE